MVCLVRRKNTRPSACSARGHYKLVDRKDVVFTARIAKRTEMTAVSQIDLPEELVTVNVTAFFPYSQVLSGEELSLWCYQRQIAVLSAKQGSVVPTDSHKLGEIIAMS